MIRKILMLGMLIVFTWQLPLLAETQDEAQSAVQDKNEMSFSEGLDYQIYYPPQAIQSENLPKDHVEVVVMFLYACPHCNELDTKLTAWANERGERVVLKRMPAILGASWADQARAYYTGEKLGIIEKTHAALFKSIHEDGEQYADEQSVMDFFIKQGVKPEDFIMAFQSEEVMEKVNQARAMTVEYGIRGVPALIVNGNYLTAQYFTGTQEKLMDVLDMLVDKELDATPKY